METAGSEIIVVGAGIGGLAAALAVHKVCPVPYLACMCRSSQPELAFLIAVHASENAHAFTFCRRLASLSLFWRKAAACVRRGHP